MNHRAHLLWWSLHEYSCNCIEAQSKHALMAPYKLKAGYMKPLKFVDKMFETSFQNI